MPRTQAEESGEGEVVQASPETRTWLLALTAKWPVDESPRPTSRESKTAQHLRAVRVDQASK
jgi:hypothetical protein